MTESLQELDRRRFVRFPVAVPVVGRAAQVGELELRGTVRNVSGGGLMAEFAIQVQHGSTVPGCSAWFGRPRRPGKCPRVS